MVNFFTSVFFKNKNVELVIWVWIFFGWSEITREILSGGQYYFVLSGEMHLDFFLIVGLKIGVEFLRHCIAIPGSVRRFVIILLLIAVQ